MSTKKLDKAQKDVRTYTRNQTPPPGILIFSSLQHMLLMIALGLSLPISTGRAAGLSTPELASYMAAALLSMGITSLLQVIPGRFFGTGYQSMSTCDSAAIAASVMAAELGGIPLVLGMTLFTGLVKFVMGLGTHKFRKLFPPYVTGTLIFILGISQVPTAFKNLFGTGESMGDPMALVVAVVSFLTMVICVLFIKPLKPFSVLVGIAIGYIVSLLTGVMSTTEFSILSEKALIALPFYSHISFSFDVRMLIPFFIVAIAGVVDNIGDYSACQFVDDPEIVKPDWKVIQKGIRAEGFGTMLVAAFGGSTQATATTNIGVSRSAGITSRAVGYGAGILIVLISFFPGVSGLLAMIPSPVLGAAVLFGMCYIMAGGFDTLRSVEMDDRKIFTVFLSIGAAISTLIPNLYDFLPDVVRSSIISPMVMGTIVLIVLTLLCRIGQKKKFSFETGVDAEAVRVLSEGIRKACGSFGIAAEVCKHFQIALSALAEGIYELDRAAVLRTDIQYDDMSVGIHVEFACDKQVENYNVGGKDGSNVINNTGRNKNISEGNNDIISKCSNDIISEGNNDGGDDISGLSVALRMVDHMFDKVQIKQNDGHVSIRLDSDL